VDIIGRKWKRGLSGCNIKKDENEQPSDCLLKGWITVRNDGGSRKRRVARDILQDAGIDGNVHMHQMMVPKKKVCSE
jgi:hypothetical protein